MENYLFRRLSTAAALDEDDRRAVEQLHERVGLFEPKKEIIGYGERPECLHLMMQGWAARYKSLPNGTRQIVGFLIPGDFCGLNMQILGTMDHSIVALSRCEVASISAKQFDKLTVRLARTLWWASLVDEAVLREWLLNIGRRESYEAAAHLLCELYCRLEQVGLVDNGQIILPLTQEGLGDALGITAIHTNRVLQRLRREGLITFKSGTLTIHDFDALCEAGGFDPEYLHLKGPQVGATATSAFHFLE